MSIGKTITDKGIDLISRAGKALVEVTVAKHPDDERFEDYQPRIDLYVVPIHEDFPTPTAKDSKGPGEEILRAASEKEINSPESGGPSETDERSTEIADFTVSGKHFKGTIPFKESRIFEIQVESINGIFKRLFNRKPKREAIEVLIVAEPPPAWKKYYNPTYIKRDLAPGGPTPLSVSLEPKQEA